MTCSMWLGSTWEAVRPKIEEQGMRYTDSVTSAPSRNVVYSGDLRVVRWRLLGDHYEFVLAHDHYSRVSGQTP